jgi:multidrug efflux system membrane fusion protein
VTLQPVEVAELQGPRAVIAKGIQAGQRVVADGQYKLKPGAPIAEAPARPAAASAPAVAANTAAAARQ